MEFFSKLSETQVSFNSILQIGVDVVMLTLLALILIVKKPRISKKDEAIMKSFEKIIHETEEISRRFEINLGQRQELLQQITAKLDQRIQEAQSLSIRLDQFSKIEGEKPVAKHSASVGAPSRGADLQKVLSLAKKGLNASEIAKSLKRPVGEVELILNLQKISE